MSQLRSIVDRTCRAFNARDFDAYRDVLDEHVDLIMAGIAVRGREAVIDFVAVRARARPGLRIEPRRVFVETDDTLVTEVRVSDTARIESEEKTSAVDTTACALYRVAGGRIVEWRVYLDPMDQEMASAALTAVAAEQSALRRVAELVARQAPPEHVFALVTEELSSLVNVSTVSTARFEPDGTATVMATRGTAEDTYPLAQTSGSRAAARSTRCFGPAARPTWRTTSTSAVRSALFSASWAHDLGPQDPS